MKDKIRSLLENLVGDHNSTGAPIISGFNYYKYPFIFPHNVLTFSNIHFCPEYLSCMLRDLLYMGFPNGNVNISIRAKVGYHKWAPGFSFRDKNGNVEKDLSIKDLNRGCNVELEEMPYNTLVDAQYCDESANYLIAQNRGCEVNLSISKVSEMYKIATLFNTKSSKYRYNKEGDVIREPRAELKKRKAWPTDWKVPVLIIGGAIEKLKRHFLGYNVATLFVYQDARGEYNFVINKYLTLLKDSAEYCQLEDMGFKVQNCLANTPFLKYIDSQHFNNM